MTNRHASPTAPMAAETHRSLSTSRSRPCLDGRVQTDAAAACAPCMRGAHDSVGASAAR
jgi:hypothetical protein